MLKDISQAEYILRIDRMREYLRFLSLNPRDFGLEELLRAKQLPTLEQVKQNLMQNDILPERLSADDIAARLLETLAKPI